VQVQSDDRLSRTCFTHATVLGAAGTTALDLDAYAWRTYSVAGTTERARFYVDDRLVRTVDQGLDYPQLLLVDLFEFPVDRERDPAAYPKTGEIAAVRGSRPAGRS
jgi:hypothetical protein